MKARCWCLSLSRGRITGMYCDGSWVRECLTIFFTKSLRSHYLARIYWEFFPLDIWSYITSSSFSYFSCFNFNCSNSTKYLWVYDNVLIYSYIHTLLHLILLENGLSYFLLNLDDPQLFSLMVDCVIVLKRPISRTRVCLEPCSLVLDRHMTTCLTRFLWNKALMEMSSHLTKTSNPMDSIGICEIHAAWRLFSFSLTFKVVLRFTCLVTHGTTEIFLWKFCFFSNISP